MNQLSFIGVIAEISVLRYTPAGMPVIELELDHSSEVEEAGLSRRLNFSISAVALGDMALQLADSPLGAVLKIQGFIAPLRKSSVRLVLHIQQAQVQYSGNATVVV
ncbi:primosomal replication protein N [Paenalcaligenes niemegkensis]|uniref:primosomal replication protein N n=1 Tax=Paenalcaligenes niemegkensis TaxID=2895469 RepID=UPI001EE7C0C0|nr:primosomal replication protein N [Paenalcaligenes niemegkensis]MCQ9615642.1 primosomal replication protein N [Paenalcaligenes niemegkensis]